MTRPPHDPEQAILSRSFVARVEFYAALITGVTLGGFVWALSGDPADVPRAMTIAFVMLALAQTFHLVNARGGDPALGWQRIISNRWAPGAALLTVALQFAALYVEPLAAVLGVTALAARDWLIVLPLALLPAIAGQIIALVRSARRGAVQQADSE